MESDRLRLIYIPIADMVKAFTTMGRPGSELHLVPKLKGLPNNYQVLEASFNYHRQAMGVKIQHNSFNEVPKGQLPGEFPYLGYEVIKVPSTHKPYGQLITHSEIVKAILFRLEGMDFTEASSADVADAAGQALADFMIHRKLSFIADVK